MPTFNHDAFIGNATRGLEVKYLDSSKKAVMKFTIAIKMQKKGADETIYLDATAWDKLGEVVNQYVENGKPIYVAGRLGIRKSTYKDGVEKTVVEVTANELTLLGGKHYGASGNGGGQCAVARPAANAAHSMLEDEIPW